MTHTLAVGLTFYVSYIAYSCCIWISPTLVMPVSAATTIVAASNWLNAIAS